MLLPFFQALSNMGWVYGADEIFAFPLMEVLVDILGQLALDLNGTIPLGCFGTHSALQALMVGTLPLMCVTGTAVAAVEGVHRVTAAGVSKARRELCYSALVFIWLILFPGISNKIFKTMRACDVFDEGQEFMFVDYSTDCHSAQYDATMAYSWFVVFMFPLGVPLLTLLLLVWQRVPVQTYQELQVHMRTALQCIHAIKDELQAAVPDTRRRLKLLWQASSLLADIKMTVELIGIPVDSVVSNGQARALTWYNTCFDRYDVTFVFLVLEFESLSARSNTLVGTNGLSC